MSGIQGVVWDVSDHIRALLPAGSGLSSSSAVTDLLPVLCAILAALLVATVLTHWRQALGSTPLAPGVPMLPGSLPLVGHSVLALTNLHRLHDWLYEVTQQMGEGRTFGFSLPLLPSSLMVTDIPSLEYLLKRNCENYPKSARFFMNLGPVLGHGIFTADGADWYWQRKLATHIFSVKSFKLYIDCVFGEKMGLLSGVVGAAAASSTPLDLHDLMYRFTLDTFGQIGFGVDPGCLRTTDKVPFAAAFDSAQVIVNERFWLPGWQVVELLNGSSSTLKSNVATIKAFALQIIQERRKQLAAATATAAAAGAKAAPNAAAANSDATLNRDQDPAAAAGSAHASGGGDGSADGGGDEGGQDLLSLFMAASGPDGKPLTMQQLQDAVVNMIIAGRDTTAQALSWTFYLLLQHPEVEQQLLAEVREVLGQPQPDSSPAAAADGSGGGSGVLRPSYDQLRRLRYARAVFMEALRLYPSVPENCKYAVQRDVLPDGTVVLPGTQVIYSPYVVNRLQSVWGPDALEFKPQRWLDMEKAPSPYQYLTFNAGPRLCLGQRLAELEGVFVLTTLLARFSFRQPVPGSQVTYTLSSTMPMKEGLLVVPQLRE